MATAITKIKVKTSDNTFEEKNIGAFAENIVYKDNVEDDILKISVQDKMYIMDTNIKNNNTSIEATVDTLTNFSNDINDLQGDIADLKILHQKITKNPFSITFNNNTVTYLSGVIEFSLNGQVFSHSFVNLEQSHLINCSIMTDTMAKTDCFITLSFNKTENTTDNTTTYTPLLTINNTVIVTNLSNGIVQTSTSTGSTLSINSIVIFSKLVS